jgi:hypothetical protein
VRRGKSKMGELLAKARGKCGVCRSVLEPVTNGYRYQSISTRYRGTSQLKAGTHSIDEFADLAERRLKQFVEYQESQRSLTAQEDDKRRLRP